MSFTIDQIKAAHAKVKSGADFPNYVQDLIKLGITHYDTYVRDGHTRYFGNEDHQVQSEPKYPALTIPSSGNGEQFKYYLKIHQQGQTDYPTFCSHAAETGVEKWTVDTVSMTCTYFDKAGNTMLVEQVPVP